MNENNKMMQMKVSRKIRFLGFSLISVLLVIGMLIPGFATTGAPEDTPLQRMTWEAKIRVYVNSSSRLTDWVVLAEDPTANDGPPVDPLDAMKPPAPPSPYVYMFLNDNLPYPNDKLIRDVRHYPDTHKIWNLTIIWMPNGGSTSTECNITWNPMNFSASEYFYVNLTDNAGNFLVDMLSTNRYTFTIPSPGMWNMFKIQCVSDVKPPEIINYSPATGETGDTFIFNASVTDNFANASDLLVKVNWSHGTLSDNITMNHVGGSYFEAAITLDENISDLTYHFYAEDSAVVPNTNYTSAYTATIIDDENPVITNTSGNVSVGTGDLVVLWVTAVDNIEVVSAEVSVDGGAPVGMSWNVSLSRWEYGYTAPLDDLSAHTYMVTVYDAQGLSNSSDSYTITVFDNDPPVLDNDSSDTIGTTGEPVTFTVDAVDNIGVTHVYVYWRKTGETGYTQQELTFISGATYTGTITVDPNDDADIEYYFEGVDAASNLGYLYDAGNPQIITILDNDPPVIIGVSGNVSVGTGDLVVLWVTAVDNIEVVSAEVSVDGGAPVGMSWNASSAQWEYLYTAPLNDDLDHTYTLTVFDAQGLSTTSSAYNILVFDNDDPVISDVHAVPQIQIVDEYVNITATVTDNIDVDLVYVTITGPTGFIPVNISMTPIGADGYYYNANYSIAGLYNYSIWACDTSGNGACSGVYQFEIAVEIPITMLLEKWNFIALPFNQSVQQTDLMFYYNGVNYNWTEAAAMGLISPYFFGWDRATQTYIFADTLEPGYGYWVYAYVSCEMRVQMARGIRDTYITEVKTNWNVFGVPLDQPINTDDLIVSYGGTDYTWADAATAGIISQYLFGWNRVAQSYEFATVLEPGFCYWLYAYHDCVLKC